MVSVEYLKNEYISVSEPVHELSLLVYNHFGKNPMGWTGIDKLTEYAHNEQFAERVFSLHDFLVRTGAILDGINPSQYYKIIYKFQLATKSINYDLSKIIQCYLDLANCAIKSYNNLYMDISRKAQECAYTPIANDSDIRTIGYLCALLRSFSESTYCDEHTISGEIFSPIIVNDGFVIARSYRNLDAYELCPELLDSPYKTISIFVKYYDDLLPPKTDIVGNLLSLNNYYSHIKGVYVEYTDKAGSAIICNSINAITDIIRFFSVLVPIVIRNYRGLSMQDRLWRKVECEYYAIKPYCDICGIDWRPAPYNLDFEMIENVNRPIVYANNIIASLIDDDDIKHKLFELNDPRKHWGKIQEVFV